MKSAILCLFAAATTLAASLGTSNAHAQTVSATVVSSCGSPPATYLAGKPYPVTQDTTGKLCDTGGGGGGGGAVTTSPAVVTPTDRSGTVTTGGTAQTAIAANSSRKGWCIQNPPTATENLQVRSGAAATSTTGVALVPGDQACNPSGIIDQVIVSVLAATSGHAWLGTEYQ